MGCVVSQSVKEVVQSLVDDNLVYTDKCGVQTVFWALPSEISQKKKTTRGMLQVSLENKKKEEKDFNKMIEQAKIGREKTDQREQLLKEIAKKEKKIEELDVCLARFQEFDPEQMSKLEDDIKQIRQATNRWVDNIFNCQSWVCKKFVMDKKDFDAQFQIPTDLDYLEP